MIKLDDIYTAQSYINEETVAEKQASKDYEIQVSYIDDDGEKKPFLVDGNHSFEAAKRDGVDPVITIVNTEYKSVVDYVEAFGDLSNPTNIITGKNLW